MEAAGKRYISWNRRKDEFKIWNIADIHLGAKGCDIPLLKRDINKIKKDPFSFWVGGGDLIDAISTRDKRFNPEELDPSLKIKDLGAIGKVCTERLRDLLQPIAHKCLGLCMGNHERKHEITNSQQDLHAWLCHELGVQNLRYSAFFDLAFFYTSKIKKPVLYTARERTEFVKKIGRTKTNTETFRVFIHHGVGASATSGGRINRLHKIMQSFEADIYMMGHVHSREATAPATQCANSPCTELKIKQKIGCISGSYMKTYAQGSTGYGEVAGYPVSRLGASCVFIKPDFRTAYVPVEAQL